MSVSLALRALLAHACFKKIIKQMIIHFFHEAIGLLSGVTYVHPFTCPGSGVKKDRIVCCFIV